MSEVSKPSVSFECRSMTEANLICNAVNRYARTVLKPQGIDLRNYAPANSEGAGFGWDAVRRAAYDMGSGTVTHMSRRMAEAIRAALVSKAEGTTDADSRILALSLAGRLSDLVRDKLSKPEDEPCEGCGAEAGEPCNPHMGCKEQAAEAQHGSAHVIHEVAWHLRKEITREAYLRDLVYAEGQGLAVRKWRGEDREGKPMVIAWIATPNGAQLAAYEIQGRA